MSKLQVSLACLLLKMSSAAVLGASNGCPTCPGGYFTKKNCTRNLGSMVGIQCQRCTNCSASHQETLVTCSTFSDSVCGNKTATIILWSETPTDAPDLALETWLILTAIVVFTFLALLLGLVLVLVFCQIRQGNNHKGLNLL
ncbi:uncharacterized protein LOC113125275 isoform X2 [Mastacembelus armatus]|uniref:uncharacterized protein LOC113125275 isoform X2 n=1 Tax=Mastacembelus armatus TaxID=205130 RepID=UPI000E45855C|nr:uncharacterized protein LOC113125275 isoform X2 [Mastacembelus armatus]